jgi:DNA-binding MarR family transcriptional regulator
MVRSRTTVKPGLLLQPFVLSQLGGLLIEQMVEGKDITPSEFALTSWVNVNGDATPTELSRELGLAPTTLSAMIERLVRKGQLRRVRHPEDGRSYVLTSTAKGRATQAAITKRFFPVISRIREHLDADEEHVLATMRILEEALRSTLAED